MRNFFLFATIMMVNASVFSQMQINGSTFYGNEWVDYSKDYISISIEQEGIYRLDYQQLLDAGFPVNFDGAQLKLETYGEEQAMFTSNEGMWADGDYLLFYGAGNDGELDKFHFKNWKEEQLNPKYSFYSDAKKYYLSLNDSGEENLRYEELDNDLSGVLPPQQEYYMHRDEKIYSEFAWSPSAPDVPDAHYSSFIKTEGFGTKLSSQHTKNFNLNAIYDAPENSRIEIRTGSNTQTEHIIHISFNNELLEIDEYSGNQVIDYSIEIPNSLLRESSELKLEGMGFSDLITLAHTSVIYPRELDAQNRTSFEFEIDSDVEEKYFEVRRFNPGGSNYLFDLSNNRFLRLELESGVAKFRIGTEGLEASRLYLVAANIGLKSPDSLELVRFSELTHRDAEYMILTSEKLNNAEAGVNPVESYANFRESQVGGDYRTAIVNVEDLYHQFAYGVDNHSLAIRNYYHYLKAQGSELQMCFIIGKGLSYGNRNKNVSIESYVPTYGKPGSDVILFTEAGITYSDIAVGRLAARNKEDIENYLRKVEAHAAIVDVANQSIEDRMWLKDIIHLSGGDPGIQLQLFNHLTSMENILENSSYGAEVTTYRKTSSDPVQTALSQQILNNINNGISMLTFFGHSSAGTFDFSVEDPGKYENEGRLPLILSMGCKSGDIHETVYSLSEDMILTEDVGAIAFVASSGSAFPTPLSVMGKDFYSKISNEFYGEPIGLALRQVSEDLYEPNSTKVRTLHEQNTLHGDPAVVLYNSEAPDYVVDFATLSTMGEVGATDESIMLSFDIVNLGRGLQDSLNNMLVHTYGSDQRDTLYFRTEAPFNRTAIQLKLNNPGFEAIGKNVIEIVLDVDDRITESPQPIAESNNSLKAAWANEGYCFFIFDNSAFPIYPPEFAIVNDPNVTLLASSTNALAEKEIYLLEIDTTENFDSPILVQTEMFASPALIEWNPNINFTNETVYYWRVRPKSSTTTIWNSSSFVFLPNSSEGWNQSHLYQWQKDTYENYSYDANERDFLFAENLNDINISNGSFPLHNITMTVQNNPSSYLSFLGDGEIPSGLYISTFDAITGLPWINKPSDDGGLYESELYTWWAQKFPNFPYETDTPENRAKAIRFIEDIIPSGNYVIVYTIQRNDFPGIGNYKPEEWAGDASINPDGRDLMSVLEKYGAQRVRDLESEARPYIFAFKKDDPDFNIQEIIADNKSESIELDLQILGSWFEGNVRSTPIGPAHRWNRIVWALEDFDLEEDSYKFDVLGIRPDGSEEYLYEDVQDFDLDISAVDSDQFPHLRLQLYSKDSISRTSAQMPYWRVLYEEIPEAVLNIPQKFVFNSDTLFLGERMRFCSNASNVTSTDMDSLLVRYTIVDTNNKESTQYQRLEPLKAKSSVTLEYEYPTDNLLGVNQFRVEINPEMDQEEKYDFNNIGVLDFVVQGDRINPILDVTFDGMRIMDGDIVSPKPHIRIELKDENEFLLLNDINAFDLALLKEPDNQSTPVDLSQSNIIFTPADTTGNNEAVLEYFPELEEGDYILYVQAKDISGNVSGDQDIEVRFKVIEDTRVSNLLNYPNPFSTSTEFIFTITGYELPEVFTIQIMTLSGKVVREITKEELGDIRIGLNRSDYKWDGRDEFGSRLANGVYLYRVLSSFDGINQTQLLNDNIDEFFNDGFGKLVIMR